MTDDPHIDDSPGAASAVAPHATDDLGDDQGHDDHAHEEEALGPVDVTAWGAGVVGVLLGLAVALAFLMATFPTTPAG